MSEKNVTTTALAPCARAARRALYTYRVHLHTHTFDVPIYDRSALNVLYVRANFSAMRVFATPRNDEKKKKYI